MGRSSTTDLINASFSLWTKFMTVAQVLCLLFDIVMTDNREASSNAVISSCAVVAVSMLVMRNNPPNHSNKKKVVVGAHLVIFFGILFAKQLANKSGMALLDPEFLRQVVVFWEKRPSKKSFGLFQNKSLQNNNSQQLVPLDLGLIQELGLQALLMEVMVVGIVTVLSALCEIFSNKHSTDSSSSSSSSSTRQLETIKEVESNDSFDVLEPSEEKKQEALIKKYGACYLVYEPDSSGRLVEYYSKVPIEGAIGMWVPGNGDKLPDFKFTQNCGRCVLIGNCSAGVLGRKNYASGWCSFVRSAQLMEGSVTLWDPVGKGLMVDVYIFDAYQETIKLHTGVPTKVGGCLAVASLMKNSPFYEGVHGITMQKWLADARAKGSSSKFKGGTGGNAVAPSAEPRGFTPRKKNKANHLGMGGNDVAPSPAEPQTSRGGTTPLKDKANIMPSPEDSEALAKAPTTPSDKTSTACNTGACYLVYDSGSSGRLVEHYSKTPVEGAIGMWTPGKGKELPPFKFNQNHGKTVLIGNCAAGVGGRKNYASGWCSFIRSARLLNGEVALWDPTGKGLLVDVYVYNDDPNNQTVKLQQGIPIKVGKCLAVACMPKNASFYEGIKGVPLRNWMEDGNRNGCSSEFKSGDDQRRLLY